jgi:lipopolysaccharide transport system permease protein
LLNALRLGWIMGSRDFVILGIGSNLGRLWPTIGLAIRIAFVGSVFGLVLGSRPLDYVPWLATGWVVWGMISSALNGCTTAFNDNKGTMLALAMPKESFLIKVIVREFLLLIQNSALIVAVVLIFQVQMNLTVFLVIPGLMLTGAFLFACGMIMAPLVSKYKDLGPFISSIIGVMFFVLPIMWKPESLQSDLAQLILGLNPFYHYLQIVRLPMLSEIPTTANYLVAGFGTLLVMLIGFVVINRTRNKIVYWA